MILKWPGGKKWLYKKHNYLFPNSYNNYIEPFFGAGSVFFSLAPNNSIIGDSNERLIKLFQMLRDHPEKLFNQTLELLETHSDNQYYKIRKKFNNPNESSPIHFLYLNRTCFNGVYRENKNKEFNVPIGRRNSNHFPFKLDDFLNFSLKLKNADISAADFRCTLSKAREGDFIYVDPPYIKFEENYEAFRKYNSDVFSKNDLADLATELNKLKNSCKILVSNFDIEFVREVFEGWRYEETEQMTYISGKGKGRKLVKEALIYNYEL